MLDDEGNKLEFSELEFITFAKNIIFLTHVILPKSRWSGVKNKMVSVPIPKRTIINNIKKLPRSPSKCGVFRTYLKRMKKFNHSYLKQMVNPYKIRQGYNALIREKHPSYIDIEENTSFEAECINDGLDITQKPIVSNENDRSSVHEPTSQNA